MEFLQQFQFPSTPQPVFLVATVVLDKLVERDGAYRARSTLSVTSPLDVQRADVEGVVLDELAAGLNLVAHQEREHLVGLHGV